MKRLLLAAGLLAACTARPGPPAPAADPRIWQPDFERAAALSTSSKRDLFVFVGGSDWSAASRAYKARVIDAQQLPPALGADFVWLEIDHPDQPTEAQKDAAKARRDFKVTIRNYPGVVLLDPEGRCYAKMEAPRGGVSELAAAVRAALALKARRDAELAQAAGTQGMERARHLGAALDLMGRGCLENDRQSHRKVLDDLRKLDPDDTVGTQRRLTFNADAFAEKELWPLTGKKQYAEAHRLVAKELADPRNTTALRQRMMALDFYVYQQEEQLDAAVRKLRELIALDPAADLARQADAYIANMTEPVVLAGPQWKPEHLRFYFAEWRLNAAGRIAGAGDYRIRFNRADGDGITVRDVALMNGATQVARADMPKRGDEVTLSVPPFTPGPVLWLKIHAKGHGWFGSRGDILIEPGKSAR